MFVYDISRWFQDTIFEDKNLSDEEKVNTIAIINETTDTFAEGLPFIHNELERISGLTDVYHEVDRAILSLSQFSLITMIDSMVACKYYILADRDYDKMFMRGKLKVILNEGFKQLYGFTPTAKASSKWASLEPLMNYFSLGIRQHYSIITKNLERLSVSSTWWKDERNYETHIDSDKLYLSRIDELVDSRVMNDSFKLFGIHMGVNEFLARINNCMVDYLNDLNDKGELKAE